jgi:hypothetical protein
MAANAQWSHGRIVASQSANGIKWDRAHGWAKRQNAFCLDALFLQKDGPFNRPNRIYARGCEAS